MYQIIDGIKCISVNDWIQAGLTQNQFKKDSQRGYLKIYRRGIRGNTLIDVKSIKRPDRLQVIERAYGPVDGSDKVIEGKIELDPKAAYYYTTYRDDTGVGLSEERQQLYINGASILNSLMKELDAKRKTKASLNNKVKWGEWWDHCVKVAKEYNETPEIAGGLPHVLPLNPRRFEDKFKQHKEFGYETLVKQSSFLKNAEKINDDAKEWVIARFASNINKTTIYQLFDEYNEKAKIEGWKTIREPATLHLFLNRPEIKPLWFGARFGELKAKEKYTRQHKTLLPTVRDSLWYADGTKLNYFYRDENGKVATCSVYEVIDVYSECLLGHHISKSEDFEAQYYAFKQAMQFSGFKPYEIKFDNQGGHKKLQSGQFFKNLSRLAINTQPYNGRSKTIESIFGRFQSAYLHRDWFFTGQNVTAKKLESKANMEFILSNVTNLPTLDEIKKLYDQRRKEWNESTHYDTGVKRIDMYRSSYNEKSQKIELIDMIKMFGVISSTPITYRSSGIIMEVKRQKYTWEVLDIDGKPDFEFLKSNVDRKFYIGYDMEDMSTVSLYSKTSTGEYRFETIAQKYIEIHRAKQEQDDLDASFIAWTDKQNKQLREELQDKAETILEKQGLHPSQSGLNMPQPRGLNHGKRKREKVLVEIGNYQKNESNLVPDTDIYSRY